MYVNKKIALQINFVLNEDRSFFKPTNLYKTVTNMTYDNDIFVESIPLIYDLFVKLSN